MANKMRNRGFIVPTMVLIMLFISISALALSTFSINHYVRIGDNLTANSSLLVAEAGAEETLNQINQNSNFAGYATEQTFFNDSTRGRGTYQTTVAAGSVSNEKIVTAAGRIYLPATDTTPKFTRKVQLTVVGTTPTSYSVQTGPGGLIMSNSATIANGDVYVNGYLQMSNSARIGSSTNPTRVWVAHVNCPTSGGASFPTQCTSGQPITLSNSAHIYAEVRATNQTNGAGMSNPGLIAGSSAPPVSLPLHDRQAQITAVANTITSSAASCSGSQSRTYEANTKITGNLNISNSCQVTVNGDVWVTDNFNISNSSSIRVGSGVTTPPTIMIDGSSANFSNNSSILANVSNIGFKFITYWSAAGCSPNCIDVTGQDLFNSRNTTTINLANSSLGAGSIFYARWSKVQLSNGGSVGGIIGQTVQLSNSGNVSFGTNLSSGESIWTIKNYHQVFD